MTVRISSFGIEVPGKVVRTYDEATGFTTLTLDSAQATVVHAATTAVLEFTASQGQQPELPLEDPEPVKAKA
jgi:hypothetical protein